jgi:hypothetical protein
MCKREGQCDYGDCGRKATTKCVVTGRKSCEGHKESNLSNPLLVKYYEDLREKYKNRPWAS